MSGLLANSRFIGTSSGPGSPVWLGTTGQLDGAGGDFTVLMGVRLKDSLVTAPWFNTAAGNDGWGLTVSSSPDLPPSMTFTAGDDGGGGVEVATGVIPAAINGVHLVAGVYDAGNELRLYIDGALVTTEALAGSYIVSAGLASLGGGSAGVKTSDVGFHSAALTPVQLGALYDDFLRTGLLRPGVVLNPNSIPTTLPNIDSVYSVARSQRTAPVQAFPSVGTGAQVTLNAVVPGPYALNLFTYDTVPVIV